MKLIKTELKRYGQQQQQKDTRVGTRVKRISVQYSFERLSTLAKKGDSTDSI